MSVIVKGLQELSRQFNRVLKEVDAGCKKAMRKITKEVADDARDAAPVSTGEYKKSIRHKMARNGLYGWAYAGKKGKTKRGYLGHLLEYGTIKMKARPHFLPALDKAKRKFEPELKSVIASVRGGKA